MNLDVMLMTREELLTIWKPFFIKKGFKESNIRLMAINDGMNGYALWADYRAMHISVQDGVMLYCIHPILEKGTEEAAYEYANKRYYSQPLNEKETFDILDDFIEEFKDRDLLDATNKEDVLETERKILGIFEKHGKKNYVTKEGYSHMIRQDKLFRERIADALILRSDCEIINGENFVNYNENYVYLRKKDLAIIIGEGFRFSFVKMPPNASVGINPEWTGLTYDGIECANDYIEFLLDNNITDASFVFLAQKAGPDFERGYKNLISLKKKDMGDVL